MTEEQLIQAILPVAQRAGMIIRTQQTAMLRVMGSPESVRGAVASPEVNQTVIHANLQAEFTRIARTYEIQHSDPAVTAQAAANVISAIARTLESEL